MKIPSPEIMVYVKDEILADTLSGTSEINQVFVGANDHSPFTGPAKNTQALNSR